MKLCSLYLYIFERLEEKQKKRKEEQKMQTKAKTNFDKGINT